MHTKLALATSAFVAAVLTAGGASAAVVLFDDFNAEGPGDDLNWDGDAVFLPTSPPGSVDLIGVGGAFDFYPGHGSYLDLDGTTGSGNDPAGEITSIANFVAGGYTVSFLLGGNARGAVAQTTRVSLGNWSVDILLNSADPLTAYVFSFNTTGGQLKFTELGPSNQQGNILDDVQLDQRRIGIGIPEPSAWALMILGFGATGAMMRRRRHAIA